jgi:hypothetical protein
VARRGYFGEWTHGEVAGVLDQHRGGIRSRRAEREAVFGERGRRPQLAATVARVATCSAQHDESFPVAVGGTVFHDAQKGVEVTAIDESFEFVAGDHTSGHG